MSINLSAVIAAQELDWGLIGSTVVTGLVVVFLILAILVLFLWLFGKVFKGIGNLQQKKAQKAAEEAAAKKAAETKKPAAPAPVQTSAAPEIEYEEEDEGYPVSFTVIGKGSIDIYHNQGYEAPDETGVLSAVFFPAG